MDKKEIEKIAIDYMVDKEANKRVRLKCGAFWSIAGALMIGFGSWVSSNIVPVKIGLKAFWDAWGK